MLEEVRLIIESLLANIKSIMTVPIHAKGLDFVIESDEFPAGLQGDQTRLQQAALNLLFG